MNHKPDAAIAAMIHDFAGIVAMNRQILAATSSVNERGADLKGATVNYRGKPWVVCYAGIVRSGDLMALLVPADDPRGELKRWAKMTDLEITNGPPAGTPEREPEPEPKREPAPEPEPWIDPFTDPAAQPTPVAYQRRSTPRRRIRD